MENLDHEAMARDIVVATTPVDLAVPLFRLAGRTESTLGLRFDLHRGLQRDLRSS
jgi:hypothetical protein